MKAVYVIAPKKLAVAGKLRLLVGRKEFDEDAIVEMERLASHYDLRGYYESDVWIPFANLQEAVPITTYNEKLFLKQRRSVVIDDDSLRYYVRILDYKIMDETSPLELQRENIKSIILNHRKVELLTQLQADLLAEAEKGGYVKRNR